jgi:hypothetical protein
MATTPPQCDRTSYPGMMPRECVILSAWLKLHEPEYDRFEYNRRIGAGVDPGPAWADNIRQMAVQNSQLRIDAIGWNGATPTIIEVKDEAGPTAIGQLLSYDAVWQVDYPGTPTPALILVTDHLQANMATVAQARGIRVDVVPVPASAMPATPYYRPA